ncbi:3' terminal RNA ribose 2'-O-methyltransferase Hen1 [Hazenella sp. IB182357]|uniref:Small RNA 2'-O-methyltransferase n=1 Tax=Polycladospora coralii TaxID=2771432 RepID=A0A926N6B0_9BACL|nr:3' terminal RNA ribose 2'-O-methyltransferase Hen1 [Polycladospora coralii]MBD1371831.1 3' terminal RNA ribose 2'-O-methyltransferase Hen1 [Polycladospora coralii]
MQLSITARGKNANVLSHLLAKNPQNKYDRTHKGARVRLVYTTFTEEEVSLCLFAEPDSIDMVQNQKNLSDITQYMNDRQFVVSSLFCSYIRSALSTALNGKPKPEWASYVAQPFQMEATFGPVATDLPDTALKQLFEPLGYQVIIQREAVSYTFTAKQKSSVRFVTISGQVPLQLLLRHIFTLIPVLDHNKHYFIDQKEIEKLRRYGEGWLDDHPLRDLIIKRTLHFSKLIREMGLTKSSKESEEKEEGQVPLNQLRYETIVHTVKSLPFHRTIVDYGAGEGKLSERLAYIEGAKEILAVEPSVHAQTLAQNRFERLRDCKNIHAQPEMVWGSLFYYDERLKGKDIMILCEVIEHLDEMRLERVFATIMGEYQPQALIVTTPNAEYNARYQLFDSYRHPDHRFEWTRAEFLNWCHQLTSCYHYEVVTTGMGENDEKYGEPTQMAVFTRRKGGEKHG